MESRWKTSCKISVCIIKEKAVSLLRYGLFCVMCYYYDIKFYTFECVLAGSILNHSVYQSCVVCFSYILCSEFFKELFSVKFYCIV